MAFDSTSQEELMQEALIFLWRLEESHPGQTQCWYLQGCRFYLQNYVRRGRSVDSARHGWTRVGEPQPDSDEEGEFHWPDTNGVIWEEISANDIISVLSAQLEPPEREALLWLAEGLSAREIASRQKVSHTLVNRRRDKIAALAVTFGIAPLAINGTGTARPRVSDATK
jgi:DNA-directed RNA polymerase specialized sigma24 family protein